MAKKEKPEGKVQVTVQQYDRMEAINNLSRAILNVSEALATNVDITISGCSFAGTGVSIDTEKGVRKTMVEKI